MTNSLTTRVLHLSAGSPEGVYAAHHANVGAWLARQIEARLHAHFADRALGREWFAVEAEEAGAALSVLAEKAAEATPHIEFLVWQDKAAARRFARA